MTREIPLIVTRHNGDETHYLVLNRDEKAEHWELPLLNYDEHNYIEMAEKLGIPPEDITNSDAEDDLLKIETDTDQEPVLSGEFREDYEGGVFVSLKRAQELLNDNHKVLLADSPEAVKSSYPE